MATLQLTRDSYCKSSPERQSDQSSSNSYSARVTKVSARAIFKRYSSRSNLIRFAPACYAAQPDDDLRVNLMAALRGIHHVAYRCRDAKETVAFYRDVLGMRFQL